MFWMPIIVISLVLANPAQTGEQHFTEWWSSYDKQLQFQTAGYQGFRRKVEMRFDSLRNYEGPLSVPQGIENKVGKVLVLFSQQNKAVLLANPVDTLSDVAFLGEEFKHELAKCSDHRSWIVALPENTWTATDLNPYCSMNYDEGRS